MRIATCALLLAVLATLGVAGNAGAKPPRAFYGVTPQVQLGEEDYTRMGQGKVGTLRTPLAWAVIDPVAPGPLDNQWESFDTLVARAAANGIRVLPTVTATPPWVSQLDSCAATCYNDPPRGDLALAAWRSFLREAVGRYGPGGTFWALNPTVTEMPIKIWQIWNEQNSPSYFSPEPDVGVYAKLVTEANRAIKETDPSAFVILGGMFGTPNGGKPPSISAWDYMKALYRRDGFATRFDGVAIHPYAQSMKGVKIQIELVRDEMVAAGDGDKGIWITEIGWASGGAPDPLNRGKKGQAKRLKQSFRYLTENRKKLNIRGIDWFSWRDPSPDFVICNWCPDSGLFTRQGFKPKPSWREFVKFTGGS